MSWLGWIILAIACGIELLRELYGYVWSRGYRRGQADGGIRGFNEGRRDEREHWQSGGEEH